MQQSRSRNVRQMRIMVDAARRLIAQKGSGFTTQELAREAGVALQTFYRHFGGKDQLLLAALEDMHAEHAVAYEEAARAIASPLDRLHFYVTLALSGLDEAGPGAMTPQFITAEHWRLHQLFPQDTMHATQPTVDLFARELRAAQEQGLLAVTGATSATRSAELMVMIVRTVYHHYAFVTKTESAGQIADQVWEFCLSGIGGRAGGRDDTFRPSSPT
jgi:AcrR family transcriptional regulator